MTALARRLAAVLREAAVSARTQPVASMLTVAMVAGMCLAVLLTTGRTVAAEQAALAQIDAAGTRSIVVRAKPEAGVTAVLVERLRAVDGIEAAAGFGPLVDVRNAAVPGGPRVAVRNVYGSVGTADMIGAGRAHRGGTDVALASTAAAHELGLRDGTGAVTTDDEQSFTVVGRLEVPPHLTFLEPLLVVPSSTVDSPAGNDPSASLAVLVVLAKSSSVVVAVEATLRGLLRDADPQGVTIESSRQLADIRAAVGGQLGSHGRATVLAIVAISAVLVAVNLLALVAMRRKDFGRRRALGATRSLIVTLLVCQVGLLAAVGSLVGVATSLTWLASTRSPLPTAHFMAAVAVAAVLTAGVAAMPPALYAARRDPLHELRVP